MITIERLTLDQLEPGMVVAHDVCNTNGTCLLPQGTALSSAVIASLRRREVDYVMVSIEEMLTRDRRVTLEDSIRARIERQFCKAGTEPIMLKLRDTLLQYRLAALEQSNSSAIPRN